MKISDCRLNREQVSELQQQVEDLQKALQSQAAKHDDVSLPEALAPGQLILLGCLDFSMAFWKEMVYAHVSIEISKLI